MKRSIITLCAALAATSASAQSLDSLLGNFQNKAKASAFDAAVESQAPGLAGITSQLSDSQKAQLLDLGLENAGTVGQVAAGASALGVLGTATGVTAQPTQPVYGTTTVQPAYQQPAQPVYGATTVQPAYQQPTQPVYGATTVQPAYQQPTQPVYGTTTVQPAYQQPAQPVYGATTVQPAYQQPAQPVYGAAPAPQPQSTATQALINGAIQLGIGALK